MRYPNRLAARKRAVTPVIATIILIAATLVLGLVVGAYATGLFGSSVDEITLTSGGLISGSTSDPLTSATANLFISLSNPGSTTYISGLTMTASNISPITAWCSAGASNCARLSFTSSGSGNSLGPGQVTNFVFFPKTGISASLGAGEAFNYVIQFATGQSISGTFVSQ